jgi:hypothetical protein
VEHRTGVEHRPSRVRFEQPRAVGGQVLDLERGGDLHQQGDGEQEVHVARCGEERRPG